jgi:hypothetical protein
VSDFTLKYILAFATVVLLIIVAAIVQNWWDARPK